MSATQDKKSLSARAAFPAGLHQPCGCLKFGMDALLLAAWAENILQAIPARNGLRIAEAGSGCGAALLALAMSHPECPCLGLEQDGSLAEAAALNAHKLNAMNAQFINMDIGGSKFFADLGDWRGKCGLVLANPPWRPPGEGNRSRQKAREAAMWAREDTFDIFCRAAWELLAHRAFFCVIIPPACLPDFFTALAQNGLGARKIMPVRPFDGKPASRLLLLCQKNAKSLPVLATDLILHESKMPDGSEKNPWTSQALEFCPWLGRKGQ